MTSGWIPLRPLDPAEVARYVGVVRNTIPGVTEHDEPAGTWRFTSMHPGLTGELRLRGGTQPGSALEYAVTADARVALRESR